MEILTELPKEIKWNVLKFLSHPVADLVKSPQFRWKGHRMRKNWAEELQDIMGRHYLRDLPASDPDAEVLAQRITERSKLQFPRKLRMEAPRLPNPRTYVTRGPSLFDGSDGSDEEEDEVRCNIS